MVDRRDVEQPHRATDGVVKGVAQPAPLIVELTNDLRVVAGQHIVVFVALLRGADHDVVVGAIEDVVAIGAGTARAGIAGRWIIADQPTGTTH